MLNQTILLNDNNLFENFLNSLNDYIFQFNLFEDQLFFFIEKELVLSRHNSKYLLKEDQKIFQANNKTEIYTSNIDTTSKEKIGKRFIDRVKYFFKMIFTKFKTFIEQMKFNFKKFIFKLLNPKGQKILQELRNIKNFNNFTIRSFEVKDLETITGNLAKVIEQIQRGKVLTDLVIKASKGQFKSDSHVTELDGENNILNIHLVTPIKAGKDSFNKGLKVITGSSIALNILKGGAVIGSAFLNPNPVTIISSLDALLTSTSSLERATYSAKNYMDIEKDSKETKAYISKDNLYHDDFRKSESGVENFCYELIFGKDNSSKRIVKDKITFSKNNLQIGVIIDNLKFMDSLMSKFESTLDICKDNLKKAEEVIEELVTRIMYKFENLKVNKEAIIRNFFYIIRVINSFYIKTSTIFLKFYIQIFKNWVALGKSVLNNSKDLE